MCLMAASCEPGPSGQNKKTGNKIQARKLEINHPGSLRFLKRYSRRMSPMNIAVKIILGLLTAFFVIFPLVSIAVWFGFIFSIIEQSYQTYPYVNTTSPFPIWLAPAFLLIFCSSFLQLGLQGFYIVHNIVNKTGSDVIRAVLGLGMFFLPYVALPVYYFIYILPKTTPKWALNQPSTQSTLPVQS
jgi:hypothetical protein